MESGKPIPHKGSENTRFVSLWLAAKASGAGLFKTFRAPQDVFQKHKRGKEPSSRLRTAPGNDQPPDYLRGLHPAPSLFLLVVMAKLGCSPKEIYLLFARKHLSEALERGNDNGQGSLKALCGVFGDCVYRCGRADVYCCRSQRLGSISIFE